MNIFDFMAIKSLCGGGSGANPNIINSDNKKLGDLSNVAVGWKEGSPGQIITWDGDITGKPVMDLYDPSVSEPFKLYYKVADYPNDISILPNITSLEVIFHCTNGAYDDSTENYSDLVKGDFAENFIGYYSEELEGLPPVLVAKEGTYNIEGFGYPAIVPEDGIYFLRDTISFVECIQYTSSFTLSEPSETIHKIPTNYLELIDPNIIGSVSKKLSNLTDIAVGWKETIPRTVITWDGDTTGKECTSLQEGLIILCKVADYTTTLPESITTQVSNEGGIIENAEVERGINRTDFKVYGDDLCMIVVGKQGMHNIGSTAIVLPSDGVYFSKFTTPGPYCGWVSSATFMAQDTELIHPIPKTYQCTTEQFNIETSAWSALNDKSPFTYKATVTAVSLNPSFAKTNLINNDAVAFANNRFAVGEISGQNITIYSVGQPSISKNLIIDFYC